MKDKETLTIILEIFRLQEQPNFSKSHIYFKSTLLTHRGFKVDEGLGQILSS